MSETVSVFSQYVFLNFMIDLILMPFANPTHKYLINKLDGINEHGGIELFVCYIKKMQAGGTHFVSYKSSNIGAGRFSKEPPF